MRFVVILGVFWIVGVIIYEMTYLLQMKYYKKDLALKEKGELLHNGDSELTPPVKLEGFRYSLRTAGFGCLLYFVLIFFVPGACYFMISQ